MATETEQKLSFMKQELQTIVDKLTEMELERDEHSLVIETLSSMEPERKCFRLVGGVLVERNVKQVLPALIANKEGVMSLSKFKILEVIKKLTDTFKEKEAEIIKLQKGK